MKRTTSVVIPVYRDAKRAFSLVQRLLAQVLPRAISLEIIVVDDGSQDSSATDLFSQTDGRVRLVLLPQNVGRSAARNEGANRAQGDYLVFLDCDCSPATDIVLSAHIESLLAGCVASTGPVLGSGAGFWARYQSEASARRERQHARGWCFAGSSQNLAVLKSAFKAVDGFDTSYRHYGFEDRDLLIRLSRSGAIVWTKEATVYHLDLLSLPMVCRKMTEAGMYNARRFSVRHPAAYKALGYAALDSRTRKWMRPLGSILGPWMSPLADRIDPTLYRSWMPYPLSRSIVKSMTGLSFLYGTTRSELDVW